MIPFVNNSVGQDRQDTRGCFETAERIEFPNAIRQCKGRRMPTRIPSHPWMSQPRRGEK